MLGGNRRRDPLAVAFGPRKENPRSSHFAGLSPSLDRGKAPRIPSNEGSQSGPRQPTVRQRKFVPLRTSSPGGRGVYIDMTALFVSLQTRLAGLRKEDGQA